MTNEEGMGARSRAGKWRGVAAKAVIVFFTTIFVALTNILGLHSALEPLSERTALRTLAAFHGSQDWDRVGQNKIAVVLIDDAYMQLSNTERRSWPLPADDFLDNILDRVVQAQPAAIFVDMSFTSIARKTSEREVPHDTSVTALQVLGEGFREASRSVPIFIADFPAISNQLVKGTSCKAVGDTANPIAPEFLKAAFQSDSDEDSSFNTPQLEIVGVTWDRPDNGYPLGSMVASAGTVTEGNGGKTPCEEVHEFLEERGTTVEPSPDLPGGYFVSPALALRKRLCDVEDLDPPVTTSALCEKDKIRQIIPPSENNGGHGFYSLSLDLEPRIAVRWGTHVSDFARKRLNPELCKGQTGFRPLEAAIQALVAYMPIDFSSGETYRPCPYFDTISAAEIGAPERMVTTPGDEDSPPRDRDMLLTGKVVLIGTDYSLVRDSVLSPFGAEVPGVYLHAAALDTLLAFGSDYPKYVEKGLGKVMELVEEGAVAVMLMWLAHWQTKAILRSSLFLTIRMPKLVFKAVLYCILVVGAPVQIFLFALSISLAIGWATHTTNFGSATFIALSAIVPYLDDLRHLIFESHENAHTHLLTTEITEISEIKVVRTRVVESG